MSAEYIYRNGKRYLAWGYAGGPNECKHGYAKGIACPNCDEENETMQDNPPQEQRTRLARNEEIEFSDDGRYYWIPRISKMGDFWLSYFKYSDEPLQPDGMGGVFSGKVEITPKGREPYWRTFLPFTFFKVKHYDHKRLKVPADDELVVDYKLVQKLRRERHA